MPPENFQRFQWVQNCNIGLIWVRATYINVHFKPFSGDHHLVTKSYSRYWKIYFSYDLTIFLRSLKKSLQLHESLTIMAQIVLYTLKKLSAKFQVDSLSIFETMNKKTVCQNEQNSITTKKG